MRQNDPEAELYRGLRPRREVARICLPMTSGPARKPQKAPCSCSVIPAAAAAVGGRLPGTGGR